MRPAYAGPRQITMFPDRRATMRRSERHGSHGFGRERGSALGLLVSGVRAFCWTTAALNPVLASCTSSCRRPRPRGFHAVKGGPPIDDQGTSPNAPASRWASAFCAVRDHSPYVSTVRVIDECPS